MRKYFHTKERHSLPSSCLMHLNISYHACLTGSREPWIKERFDTFMHFGVLDTSDLLRPHDRVSHFYLVSHTTCLHLMDKLFFSHVFHYPFLLSQHALQFWKSSWLWVNRRKASSLIQEKKSNLETNEANCLKGLWEAIIEILLFPIQWSLLSKRKSWLCLLSSVFHQSFRLDFKETLDWLSNGILFFSKRIWLLEFHFLIPSWRRG